MLERIRLRWQVVVAVGVLQLVGLAVGAVIILVNARHAVEIEVAASEESARVLVLSSIEALREEMPASEIPNALAERLVQPRHVRLRVMDAARGPLTLASPPVENAQPVAPTLFADMIMPPLREFRIEIPAGGPSPGHVLLTTEPGDEIDEVWQDTRALLMIAGATYFGTMVLLIVVVGRALRPLDELSRGLSALQGGNLTSRLPRVRAADLAPLVDRFNSLAEGLSRTEIERNALHRKIVEIGDAERKAIAMELHDELGPCLFALKVKALSIRRAADKAVDATLVREAEQVQAIVAQIQASNARLLTTLRPMAIGQLSLVDAVADLAEEFRQRHPDIHWVLDLADTVPPTDETTDLTVFRFFQEGMTNSLKHAAPTRIRVSMRSRRTPTGNVELTLVVADDGPGISENAAGRGRGLSAMRDRILAVGGHLVIGRDDDRGTSLSARLPLDRQMAASLGDEAVS